jgi:hypothetical protein
MRPLLQKLTEKWRSDGLAIPAGVSQETINQFENERGVKLPDDMREYFLAVNGMGEKGPWDDDVFSFWPLNEVRSIKEYAPPHFILPPTAAE